MRINTFSKQVIFIYSLTILIFVNEKLLLLFGIELSS